MARIAIVGGGAAGVLSARCIIEVFSDLRELKAVDIYERNPNGWARGLAFSTRNPQHILNMRATTMSSDPQTPSSFADWALATAGTSHEYPPRDFFGTYLQEMLKTPPIWPKSKERN